jgi:hypothetical protein
MTWTGPPPPWECRDEADRETFITFTLVKLDELIEEHYLNSMTAEEIARIGGELSPEGVAEVGGEEIARRLRDNWEKALDEMPKADLLARLRRRIEAAVKKNNPLALVQIMRRHDYPELVESVEQAQKHRAERRAKKTRGRERGDPRSTDYTAWERELYAMAAKDMDLIRQIWKCEYGRTNRGPNNRPTTLDIVIRRYAPYDDAECRFRKRLMSWLSNRPRRG